jgi:endonuclease G
VVVHKERKFAFFAATNIDGKTWNAEIKDRIEFAKDPAMDNEYQTGDELYDFYKSKAHNDFDKGHISKFQDPQWGDSVTINKAANDTMRYTNCVPQHHTLNRGAWKSLEDYVIKKFTTKEGKDGQKITVFAGPVLSGNDPYYIDLIESKPLQIPCHFWKVIVYRNIQQKLSAAAFIMSQEKILKKYRFIVNKPKDIREKTLFRSKAAVDFFKDFKKGEPYQVRIDFVEKVTGLSFGLDGVNQPYTVQQPQEVIYRRVEVPVPKGMAELNYGQSPLNFEFAKIKL